MSTSSSFSQSGEVVDVVIDPQFVGDSCAKMMNGWEKDDSIEQSADINTGVKNDSNNRMLVLAKNKAGDIGP